MSLYIRSKVIDTVPSFLGIIRNGMPSVRGMGSLASKVKIHMRNRTMEGKAVGGADFPPYSEKTYYAPIENRAPGYPTPSGGVQTKGGKGKTMRYDSYADYKSKMGFGARVQLSVTGQMLSDMVSQVISKTRAVLFFASRLSQAKAHRHHHGKYEFFGCDLRTEKMANEEIVKQFRALRAKAEREQKARVKAA